MSQDTKPMPEPSPEDGHSEEPSQGPAEAEAQPLKATAWRLLRFLLLLYAGLFLFAIFGSEGLLFQPHAAGYKSINGQLELTTKDGRKITAVFLPASQANAPCLLYSHGNAEDLGDIHRIIKRFPKLCGVSVLAYDYAGYGQSPGTPTEAGSYLDIQAAYDYLRTEKKLSPERIILHGRSVGGGPTCHLAGRVEHAGLILESTFVSAFRVAIPFKILPWERFPSIDTVRNYKKPVLVIHGERDRVVPFWHGQALFDACPSASKQSMFLKHVGHNNLVSKTGPLYYKAIKEFVDGLKKPPGKQ